MGDTQRVFQSETEALPIHGVPNSYVEAGSQPPFVCGKLRAWRFAIFNPECNP
jgi:hypothetical protein